jgi:hypothetical protein
MDQPVHEREFVGIFLAVDRIAVGEIDAREADDARPGWDHRLDITRLRVRPVARQAAFDLEGPFGENGDAVEGLLPVRRDVVAELLDLGAREGLVEAFDLLQAQSVGLDVLEIVEEMRQPLANRIDVPGRDDQGGAPWACVSRAAFSHGLAGKGRSRGRRTRSVEDRDAIIAPRRRLKPWRARRLAFGERPGLSRERTAIRMASESIP